MITHPGGNENGRVGGNRVMVLNNYCDRNGLMLRDNLRGEEKEDGGCTYMSRSLYSQVMQ